jgi:hypothetical protein
MTAAEWLVAARESGLAVYLDPRPGKRVLYVQRPVHVTGISDPEPYHPERWSALNAELEEIGGRGLSEELGNSPTRSSPARRSWRRTSSPAA